MANRVFSFFWGEPGVIFFALSAAVFSLHCFETRQLRGSNVQSNGSEEKRLVVHKIRALELSGVLV